jgi:hypothetical protein
VSKARAQGPPARYDPAHPATLPKAKAQAGTKYIDSAMYAAQLQPHLANYDEDQLERMQQLICRASSFRFYWVKKGFFTGVFNDFNVYNAAVHGYAGAEGAGATSWAKACDAFNGVTDGGTVNNKTTCYLAAPQKIQIPISVQPRHLHDSPQPYHRQPNYELTNPPAAAS